MSKIVRLPQYKWTDEREVEYHFPESWNVTTYDFAGANRPVMNGAQVKATITSPIGSPRLKELARGKKKVVILFETMIQPARLSTAVSAILEELKDGGINDDHIEFICATGGEQIWTREDFEKKLGADIPSRFPVFNHCPFMNCTHLGKTSYGKLVEVNTEVISCDLKITLVGNLPHGRFGYTGVCSIVMPGISSYKALTQYDKLGIIQAGFTSKRGLAEGNPNTLDAIEMANMVGIDFTVNILQNNWGEPVAIYAGSLEPAYWAVVKDANSHFHVDCPRDNDIVIANTFAQPHLSVFHRGDDAMRYIKPTGGSVVIITNVVAGQVILFNAGAFGKTIGGIQFTQHTIPANINHLIIHSEFPEARTPDNLAEKDRPRLSCLNNWTDVVLSLQNWHGVKSKVAVLIDAPLSIDNRTL
jgi:nickel-dependent lactate racemase